MTVNPTRPPAPVPASTASVSATAGHAAAASSTTSRSAGTAAAPPRVAHMLLLMLWLVFTAIGEHSLRGQRRWVRDVAWAG
jgi:hypothetical protein